MILAPQSCSLMTVWTATTCRRGSGAEFYQLRSVVLFTAWIILLFTGPPKVMVIAYMAELLHDIRASIHTSAYYSWNSCWHDLLVLLCVPTESNYTAHLGDLISPAFSFLWTDENFRTDVKSGVYDHYDLELQKESDVINNESWGCRLIPLRWPQCNQMFYLLCIWSHKSVFGFL